MIDSSDDDAVYSLLLFDIWLEFSVLKVKPSLAISVTVISYLGFIHITSKKYLLRHD